MEMPKKGKAKKGKGKAKGKAKGAIEKEDILKKTKELLKIYPACCSSENSSSGAILVSSLKRCVEEEKPLIKVSALYNFWLSSCSSAQFH